MSHSMTPPECNYPIHNKEMLAIIKATETWCHYLEATPYPFEIWTNHNNLMYFLKSQNLSRRQARWQLWMSRFNYSLVYKKGTQLHVADPLSRWSDHYVHSSSDNQAQTLLQPAVVCTLDVTSSSHDKHQQLITQFHDLPVAGHRGVKAMYNALRKHYWWTSMKEQVQTYIRHCQSCQKSKAPNQSTSGELKPLPTPEGPWQDITIDFTEMPKSEGYDNVLVVVDRFSKEAAFIPCTKEETALSTAELFRDHVWCQHGLPSTVVSDRGSVFASQFLGELYKILGIKRQMSTAFHPQTDGQTERLN
jgi:Integrase zinc binding domain/RNase H-like domain found in reverse transcriptase/Integrase core domain